VGSGFDSRRFLFGCTTKLKEGFYHLPYQMKSGGDYLCLREKTLDNAAEWRA